jgi:steroid delta-isomerase-like uncharacterized protein
MSVEDNVRLMRRWFQEVWNEGKIETVNELLRDDAVGYGQVRGHVAVRGPKEFIPFVKQIRGAFPDIRVAIGDAWGAGDQVVLRWTATMAHTGDGLGVPPTGRSVRITGITIARIRDGRIVEGWDNWDQLGLLEQIGAYSAPEALKLEKSA